MKRDFLVSAILDSSIDGHFAIDAEDRYVFWNAAMARISGMPASDVLGRVASEIFPFLVHSGEIDFHRRALAGEPCVSRERQFSVPESGREGWVDQHYTPLRDEHGAVVGAIVLVHDTTERKLAQARISETEQRFQDMANASPVLLWMSGTDSLCTFFNQTWLDFTGRTLDEEWGIGWAEGVHFEDLQRCMDVYEAAFGRREPFEMEYRLRRADGEFRTILDRGAPRYDAEGAFAGYIGSCTDITDRKLLEAELRERVRLRDEFISIASHELRTPLSAMRLQVDGLLRAEARSTALSAEERARRMRNVGASVERLEQLVSRLLDVSRMRAGSPALDVSEVDLAELTRETCERMGDEVVRAGSKIDFHAPEPVVGTWDRDKVDQVLVNLLANAVKYGAGRPIHVHVAPVGVDDAFARVIVRDEGIGIAEGDQRRIFDRFERAVSTQSYGGFGLGLWIASEIVRASGGRIDLESAPGRGATFTVMLPRGVP